MTRVPLPNEPFVDARGSITNLTTSGCQSVAVIVSEKSSVRARHHHEDEHTLYVVSGAVEYYQRPIGSTALPEPQVFRAGDFFWTPANVDHAMRFLMPTVMVSIASGVRDTEHHEASVTRTRWPELDE